VIRKGSASVIRERVIFGWDWLLGISKNPATRTALARVDPDPFRDRFREAISAKAVRQLLQLASQKEAEEQPAEFAAFMGQISDIPVDRRRQFLQKALWDRPGDSSILAAMGETYRNKEKENVDERLRWYQALIASSPDNLVGFNNLGVALSDKKQEDAAISLLRKGIEHHPNAVLLHANLGKALLQKKELDAAIACYQKAIELNPNLAVAHTNLGSALGERGNFNEAIASFDQSIKINPNDANTYLNKGYLLQENKKIDAAIACYQKAIELEPEGQGAAISQNNLGNALNTIGRSREAMDSYRKAIELDPTYAFPHYHLGAVLHGQQKLDEAIPHYRKAIALDPDLPAPRESLGNILEFQGKLQEAAVCFQYLVEKEPTNSKYKNLLKKVNQKIMVSAKLQSLVRGEYQPGTNLERFALAELCLRENLHYTAVKLYSAAFASDPKIADELLTYSYRYNAVCHALLASTGVGTDSAKLNDSERTRLRRQALDWLKADLVVYQTWLGKGSNDQNRSVIVRLTHWQKDPDLSPIRDKAPLSNLPPEEAKAFTQLWAEVASTLEKAKNPPK